MEITSRKSELFRRVRRVATVICAVGVMLALLLTVLSSCATGAVKQAELKDVHSDTYTSDIADNLNNRPLAKQYFVAAVRGYNMLAEGFNDGDLEAMRQDPKYYVEGINMDAVRAILLEKEADWHVRPDSAGEAYEAIVNGLTADEVYSETDGCIVSHMQQKIDTSNSGAWDTIMRGIGTALKWVSDHLAFHSYLLALFIFAVALEIVMLPFGIRQQKNSIKQAKLRPKEMAIRNKYKGRTDQATMQKMQAEIQELYQKENFNPMGSCLPMLLQLPIIFILYYIVIDPLHYMMGFSNGVTNALSIFAMTPQAAGGAGLTISSTNRGTIEVFSHIDQGFLDKFGDFLYYSNAREAVSNIVVDQLPNFNIGPVNFGLVPAFSEPWILLIVPVLTFAVYFGSMKLTRKLTYQAPSTQDQQTGCSNNLMDIAMPLFSVWIAFTVPAVVGVYWIFKSLLSTLKQFILSRVMPLPVYTEEDYKAAAKEMGGKGPKPVKKYNRETGNPRVRSLHHIDDEDFEDTREKAERRKQAEQELEEYERPKAPKTPTSTKEEIAAARMKMGRLEENKKRHEEEEESASTDTPVDKVDSSDASDKADATDKTDTTETPDTSDKSDASDKTDADKQ